MDIQNKKVLVTGAAGMIGVSLVKLLKEKGAKVTTSDLRPMDKPDHIMGDLRERSFCNEICKGQEIVFHLAGIKGSPQTALKKPARYFVPMLQFNTNMMEAAFNNKAEWYLFTSSVGVYRQAEILIEDDVWKTFPTENDTYPAWAKRMGELQADTYAIEHDWKRVSIVRPANVYGPFDDFGEHAMVIPSLIKKAVNNPVIEVWGDGSQIRDFIFSEDVARGMVHMVEKEVLEPVNLGSGTGVTIKELAEIVAEYFGKEIRWDLSKPTGDRIRIMSTKRAEGTGFKAITGFKEGVLKTIKWYLSQLHNSKK